MYIADGLFFILLHIFSGFNIFLFSFGCISLFALCHHCPLLFAPTHFPFLPSGVPCVALSAFITRNLRIFTFSFN